MIWIFELEQKQRVMLEYRGNHLLARPLVKGVYGEETLLAEMVFCFWGGVVYQNSLFFLYQDEGNHFWLRNVYDEKVYWEFDLNQEELFRDKQIQAGLYVMDQKMVILLAGVSKKDCVAKWVYPFERGMDQMIKKQDSDIKQKEKEIQKLRAMIESAKRQYNDLMEVATKYRDEAMRWRSKFR